MINRCHWCNIDNPLYVKYHDDEWGRLNLDDSYLFEMLFLETFQAGLSWECILNKREDFRIAFSNFDPAKIAKYDQCNIAKLLSNEKIVRNKLKIQAAITNAKIFLDIQNEYSSFNMYLLKFWDGNIIKENDRTTNCLSNCLSFDLKKRGMKFVGSTIVYSFLQAVGIINSHEDNCFLGGGKDE